MYLFQFTVVLNPDFSCSKSFFFDKVTTGAYNFVFIIRNVADVGEVSPYVSVIALLSKLVITQFLLQVKTNSISQFISGISEVPQKLLKYFSGTTILTFFVPNQSAS